MSAQDDELAALLWEGQACLESGNPELEARGRATLATLVERTPLAAWLLSYGLMEGVGGPADVGGGLSLLASAAERGVAEAAFELGQLLARAGETEEAMGWLRRAGDAEHPGALRMLGRLLAARGDPEGSALALTAATAAGSSQATYDRFLLWAEFGPTETLIAELDAILCRRALPAGLLGELARLVAARDPESVLPLAVTVTSQGRAGRQAFIDGLARGNPLLAAELGGDLRAVLELE